uniref:Uncharacterized protein n=1 Tax=Globodera rostochiensis TaxID=31243 RepID=A0A914GTG6_GLORO
MGQPGSDNRCQDPVESKTNDQQQQQKHSEALSKLRQWQSRISTGMDQILPGLFVGGLRPTFLGRQALSTSFTGV